MGQCGKSGKRKVENGKLLALRTEMCYNTDISSDHITERG